MSPSEHSEPQRRHWLRWIVGVIVALLFAVQLVPYGWQHPNPPVTAEPVWTNARAELLARRACYPCHSNETDWPAYSYVAPMSWLVRRDVENGRDKLNFSEWDDGEADDAADAVADGSMPPDRYKIVHRDAELSDSEIQELIAGLRAVDRAEDER